MMKSIIVIALAIWCVSGDRPSYRICVPRIVLPACNELVSRKSDIATIECVAGRDRVDCLDIVEKREADFMAVDPEDLYLAFKKKNEDFAVFSDIRTIEEPTAEFRYEGIILAKKSANINSLAELRGKNSCHTGYGRNVGFKIPIAKLKKYNVFKVDPDTGLSPVERELKALSELFTKSCLVGSYSANPEVDALLKKRYPNLCALCEDPVKCGYPDRFSGYDGSIRCLENGGDIAFTKVIYVKRHFGLPIGNSPAAATEAQSNPDDYEYLCEDGTKRPITGTACTWAQRPWQSYMGNGDIRTKELEKLQRRVEIMYEDGKTVDHADFAKKMLVDTKNKVVAKDTVILPGDHLTKAKYMDVIERELLDGDSEDEKIKMCVSSPIEMLKCNVLKDVAFSRDIRPKFECIEKAKTQCEKALENGEVDVVVVKPLDYATFTHVNSKPILYEAFAEDDSYVVIADTDAPNDVLKKGALKFDESKLRSVDAALYYNEKRLKENCPNTLKSAPEGVIEVVHAKDLKKYTNKVLICKDFTRRPLSDYKNCNFDFTFPTAIFVRREQSTSRIDSFKHAFIALSDKFGHNGKFEDVFELFGEYEAGQANVLFDDDAAKFVTERNLNVDEKSYKKMKCFT